MTHSYTTLGGKIVREAYGSNIIDYFYDNSGRPYKLVINENGSTSTGYFVLNLQGDVIAILDSSGAVAVEYEYDAWGKETGHTTSGSSGNSLYSYNALKYRGYYYDADLGLYYLNSRYYDPEIGRFISADTADVLTASLTALTDKNLYAYCDNNPVMRADYGGEFWVEVGIMAVGGIIGAGISAASFIATQNGPINPKSFGVAVVSGFISGAFAASSVGLPGQVVAGAIIGGGSYIVDSLINNKAIKLDEVIAATAAGAISGRIGGPGANQYGALSKAIELSAKTTAKYSAKSSAKYAIKRITSAKSYRNNILSISAWGSSARFSAGIGATNMITNTWSEVKSWFSGLFK